MRIALLDRGIVAYTIELANALSERHALTLLVPRHAYAERAGALSDAVDLRLLDWPRMRDPRNLLFVRRLQRLIEELDSDVVHFQDTQAWLNLLFPLLKKPAFVTTVHDVVPHPGEVAFQQIPRFIGHHTLRRSDRVIAHGHYLKRLITDLAGVDADRIDVVPHGVLNLYRIPSSGTPRPAAETTAPRILFFGRIFRYKGLEHLIRAQPMISRSCPDARIVIAGTGEPFERYRAILPDPDKFEIHNRFIPDAEVAELFEQATIVVLPYIEASQSGVVQLAFAFGKPVVATRVGSIPEALDDGETGTLVPPGDPDALASAIVELLGDGDRRQQMERRIRHQVETRFSWRTIAEATTETYERAIRHKGAG